MNTETAALNTDKELWRESDDAFANSIHLTKGGGIGIDCGGYVIVAPLKTWHRWGKAYVITSGPSTRPGSSEETEPYFLEADYTRGCKECGHGKMWDIIQPGGVAMATSYGDQEEAEEICDMLNIAYALGRASNARV